MTIKRIFSLPEEILEQFDALVPKSKRSRFVNTASKAALQQKAREKALDALEAMNNPKLTGEDVVNTIRQIRRASAERL